MIWKDIVLIRYERDRPLRSGDEVRHERICGRVCDIDGVRMLKIPTLPRPEFVRSQRDELSGELSAIVQFMKNRKDRERQPIPCRYVIPLPGNGQDRDDYNIIASGKIDGGLLLVVGRECDVGNIHPL